VPTDRETCGSIGLVGATDRISLSVSATARRQGFFATDASEVGVGSASALSKIPLKYRVLQQSRRSVPFW
jgi:hypothetical protein